MTDKAELANEIEKYAYRAGQGIIVDYLNEAVDLIRSYERMEKQFDVLAEVAKRALTLAENK